MIRHPRDDAVQIGLSLAHENDVVRNTWGRSTGLRKALSFSIPKNPNDRVPLLHTLARNIVVDSLYGSIGDIAVEKGTKKGEFTLNYKYFHGLMSDFDRAMLSRSVILAY